jgi:hypothetical protein
LNFLKDIFSRNRPAKNKVAVVIPIYKTEMDDFEQISLAQCLSVLGKHPIIFVKPESLVFSVSRPDLAIEYVSFPDHYFKNIAGYNQLLISKEFYTRFLDFEYILIHQLDAYVFVDQLLDWCAKGFDYVGSPYLEPGHQLSNFLDKRRIVLNGGLSLRKVRAALRFLTLYQAISKPWVGNEDALFSLHSRKLLHFIPFCNLPTWNEALPFGFEQFPQYCYHLNNNQLPFGCHAFEKYDFDFWKPFFKNPSE